MPSRPRQHSQAGPDMVFMLFVAFVFLSALACIIVSVIPLPY